MDPFLPPLMAQKPYKTREKRQSCQIDPCLPPYILLIGVPRVDTSRREEKLGGWGKSLGEFTHSFYLYTPTSNLLSKFACGCQQSSYFTPVAPTSTTSTHSTSCTAGVPPLLQLASATVKEHGSRFQTGRVEDGFAHGVGISSQPLGPDSRQGDLQSYSPCRECRFTLEHERTLASDTLQAILHASMALTHGRAQLLFLIKSIATTAIRSRSSLSIQDREKALAMASV